MRKLIHFYQYKIVQHCLTLNILSNQKLHHHIANIRHDYLHKVTTSISKSHAMIACEDLKVANMSKSASGTVENKGRQVKAKSGLNKSILDQGWGMMVNMLEYKQQWHGGLLIKVNPRYTSQTCFECKYVAKDNRQTQAKFECVKCGHQMREADKEAREHVRKEEQVIGIFHPD